jgi:3-isopropylmalate/(R)-2-methylmalate dehydratase large subunit
MGMTMAEKILARTSGQASVEAGDIVVCQVDTAVQLDISFITHRIVPERVWNPEKIVVIADHVVPAPSVEAADGHQIMRHFVEKFGIKHFYDIGRHGIVHQALAEHGHALPGTLLAAGDSHTCASGAFNCAARGLGGPEMLFVVCTGQTWFLVGPTVRFVLSGTLPERVAPRDVIHYIAGEYGDFAGKNLEFVGPTVESMSLAGRQNIATMSAEVSAEFALFEADDKTTAYIRERTESPFQPVVSDPDASFEAVHHVDVSTLSPQVALPGKVPHNVKSVEDLQGIKITQAFIGSCANGRLEDLAVAAGMLKGRKIHPSVRLIVTPGSQAVYLDAVKAGYVETLVEADAVVTNSTCGACGGGHLGVLAPNDVCITASTRNFQGRMGSPSAKVYLGSPATVTASAIKGEIADPRDID